MNYERLKLIASSWMNEFWRNKNFKAFRDLHAEQFIDRSPAGRGSDRDAFLEGIKELYAAFPNFDAVIEDLIIDAVTGKVAVRWTAKGTHKGAFMNFSPTGREIVFNGIEIIKIENDKITERWGEWDGVDLERQLG